MNDTRDLEIFQALKIKYLTTQIEISRGVTSVLEEETDQKRMRTTQKDVKYDCHDIRILIKNNAPADLSIPQIVFTGLVLFVEFGKAQEKTLRRWGKYHLPKIDLRYADQKIDNPRINNRNFFPVTGNEYFPQITDNERSHGLFLFPGNSVTYNMNVLLAECWDENEMKFWVETSISRRHLFHCKHEISIK